MDNMNVTNTTFVSKRNRSFERRSAQTSRAGWKPRQTSKARLAKDIAHSIKMHKNRAISDYTLDSELEIMVQMELGC